MPLNIALRSPVVQRAKFRPLPVASLHWRRLRGSLSVLVLFVSLTSPNAIAQGVANEYQVKAAFLYNFAKFVEWPDGTFANSTSALTVCVLGKDPFGKVLDDAILGKRIAGHPAMLARAMRTQDLPECQIIFVSASDSPQLPEILRGLQGRKVLVVGESKNFAGSGGAIQFVLEAN